MRTNDDLDEPDESLGGDEPEPVDCPMCDGPAGVLGTLGRLTHYCCRDCGWQFSRP